MTSIVAKLEDYQDLSQAGADGGDDGFDGLRRMQAEFVVARPDRAGCKLDMGAWEAGEIGACTLEFPTLKQAKKWLKAHDDPVGMKPQGRRQDNGRSTSN